MGLATDRVARYLTIAGSGKMSCLAGIGGRLPGFIQGVKDAEKVVVIDGCKLECAARCMREAGCPDFIHVRLNDLGHEKGKTPVTDELVTMIGEQIGRVMEKGASGENR